MIKIRLSVLLGERRMTQADLARITKIRPSTINELYHELTDRINLEHLDLISVIKNWTNVLCLRGYSRPVFSEYSLLFLIRLSS